MAINMDSVSLLTKKARSMKENSSKIKRMEKAESFIQMVITMKGSLKMMKNGDKVFFSRKMEKRLRVISSMTLCMVRLS